MREDSRQPGRNKEVDRASGELDRRPVEILLRFHTAVKIVRLYEPNNFLFLQQLKELFLLLDRALRKEGLAVISLWQNTLFFNKFKLHLAVQIYHIFRFVIDEFRSKEIGAISFLPGLSEEDLKKFIVFFSSTGKKKRIHFEEFAKGMKAAGIRNVAAEEISPDELRTTPEQRAVKDYFLSIIHLSDLFNREQKGNVISLHTTRRLMQSLVRNIIDNESFVQGLTTIKNFDEYTLNHSVNVCILSMALGNRLGLDKKEIVDLGICAFFHDIGKLDTPLEILNKPGKLTDEERRVIEKHPHQGAGKLIHMEDFPQLPLRAVHVSLEHHIKEDFTGYPTYFRKNSVNLFSKIVKIVDFFDAITTKRVYRPKTFTREEALELMTKESGKEFHPLLLKVFISMMGAYPVGSLVLLDTGEVAVVVENSPEVRDFQSPRVRLVTDREGVKIEGDVVDLTEIDHQTGRIRRHIVKSLDPEKYGIRVADYFLAQTEGPTS